MEGKKATAFQIKIVAEGCTNLRSIHGMHVYTNSDQCKELQKIDPILTSIELKVPGISQMALNHVRHADLCSPTSTTAAVRYLSNDDTIDPLCFAQGVWDSGFDIYGNWVFNVAEAWTHLGEGWDCWVEKLQGFNDIYSYLKQRTPVIVSVRGPLPGSAQPYAKGHLMAVVGYDSLNQKVVCMDPAFPKDDETHVAYSLLDFVQAWNRRGNVAYVFQRSSF
jgi:Peptidase_C39 like family